MAKWFGILEKEHQKSVEEMRENLFDSEVFDNVDAKDMQRLRSAADEEEAILKLLQTK